MSNTDSLRELEDFVHERIPITRAVGIRFVPAKGARFAAEAPIGINHNHQGTAFGGSINATATVAAYGLLWLYVREESATVVIRKSSIRFLRPVREVIRAICAPPDAIELERFLAGLREKGKAEIELTVTVEENGCVAAEFRGSFLASKVGTNRKLTLANEW